MNNGDSFCNPNPHIQGKNMNKKMAPKLPNSPCFEAFGITFCPDLCSYFCLVCRGHWRTIHGARNFYKLIPLPVFFCIFFCNFYGNSLRRGYCTKTKQEWPDSGSTLENIFCNFYEINSSQLFFCIANILVLMAYF